MGKKKFKCCDGTPRSEDQLFKLVFRRDNGKFVGVEAPGKEKKLKYYTPKQLKAKKMDIINSDTKKVEKNILFADLLHTADIKTCKLVDIKGYSICGGTCGGVAFSWC